MGEYVHAGAIPPKEERLLLLHRAVHEIRSRGKGFLVHRFHALFGQRTRVFNAAAGSRFDDAARSELLLEFRIFGVIRVLRFFLGVQVIEVAEELVEAVIGRQMFIQIAQMVLPELSGHVSLRLQQFGNRRILTLQAFLGSWQAHFQEARPEAALSSDERCAPRCAGLFAIGVREEHALFRDAIYIGRPVTHHALVVGTDVPVADVIAPDDQDVRFLVLCVGNAGSKQDCH